MTFFTRKFEKWDVENFWGSSSIRWKWEKIKKKFFLMKLKIWNPYGLRISHIKFEWNRRQKFFFPKGGDPLIFFWFSKNNQRVPPLNRKKIFVSDSTQIFFVKSLGHKDCMFRISSKSETNFFFPKGGPFGIFLIFKKSSKGPPFESEKNFCLRFHSNFMCEILRS